MEDWAEIRRLRRAEGLPIKVIARTLKISKRTVKSALADDAPPKYERPPRGSIVDAVEPRIRELLQVYPTMPGQGERRADRLAALHPSALVTGGRVATGICRQTRPGRTPAAVGTTEE